MKRDVVVGYKPRGLILSYFLGALLCMIACGAIMYYLISPYLDTTFSKIVTIVGSALFILIIILLITSKTTLCEFWEITNNEIHIGGGTSMEMVEYFSIDLIKNGNNIDVYTTKIKISEIETIAILWHGTLGGSYSGLIKIYRIYLLLILKDGSKIRINGLTISYPDEFLKAVTILKEDYHVIVKDKDNIISAMQHNNDMQKYLKKLDEEKAHAKEANSIN